MERNQRRKIYIQNWVFIINRLTIEATKFFAYPICLFLEHKFRERQKMGSCKRCGMEIYNER